VSALRVGYELTGLELDAAGSARAVTGLRGALEARDDVELVALSQPGRRRGPAGRQIRGLVRELAYFPLSLPRQARRAGVDLLHCPMPLAPISPRMPMVVTVFDVLAWEHPEWFGRGLVVQQRIALSRALRRAARVLTPSHHSRERIDEVLGLDPARVEVTPYGVGELFTPGPRPDALLRERGIRAPYLLSVGTLQPRKNLEAALEAFERLAKAGMDHDLVVAGSRGWRDAELVARLERSPLSSRIHVLGRVADAALVELYRGADCLVFPSLAEGFGFPPLEAMACGTPVVCFDAPALTELVGEAALLVDPEDPGGLAGAVERVANEPGLRARLAGEGIERAGRFTWARCVQLTVAAYRHALGR
jgi:glycosyltransferase involved in cell wall biosynthesis